MSEPAVTRANERYRMIAGILAQLGTALFGAGVIRSYYNQVVSLEAAGWFNGFDAYVGELEHIGSA